MPAGSGLIWVYTHDEGHNKQVQKTFNRIIIIVNTSSSFFFCASFFFEGGCFLAGFLAPFPFFVFRCHPFAGFGES